MIETIILYFFIFILCESIFYYYKKEKQVTFGKVCIVPIVLLSLLAGLRSTNVGTDTLGYYSIFHGTDIYEMEPGLPLVIRLVKIFSDNATVFFLVVSFLIVFLFIRAFWEYKEICPLHYSFFLFYFLVYFMTFSGIRQWLAAAIVFFASHYLLLKNRVLPFVMGIGIATLFHMSAIVSVLILGLWVVFQVKSAVKKMFFIITISVVVLFGYNYISSILYVRYNHFLGNIVEFEISFIFYYRMLLVMLCYYIYRKRQNGEYTEVVVQKVNVVDLAAYSLGFFEGSIGRLAWYFLPISLVFYGAVLNKKDKTLLGHITNFMIILFTLYSFYSLMDPLNKLSIYSFGGN